jgi:hypothetical protein
MRLIDKDATIKALREDPVGFNLSAKNNVDGWIEARPDVPAIPLDWIRGYIEMCDMFQLRVNVPASKIISVMVKTWKQENPGVKRGGTDAVNN